MLKLTQNKVSQHLADIFNLSFKTGDFLDSLKIANISLKIAPYLLSNLDKILEKLMHSMTYGIS